MLSDHPVTTPVLPSYMASQSMVNIGPQSGRQIGAILLFVCAKSIGDDSLKNPILSFRKFGLNALGIIF